MKPEIRAWMFKNGWTEDRFGNFKKVRNGNKYRMKVQANSLRYEVWSGTGWVRLRSGYFKDLSVAPDGKLSGLRRGY